MCQALFRFLQYVNSFTPYNNLWDEGSIYYYSNFIDNETEVRKITLPQVTLLICVDGKMEFTSASLAPKIPHLSTTRYCAIITDNYGII